MARTIKIDKDGLVLMSDFGHIIADIDAVKYYSLKVNKDRTLTLKFYDKAKKLVRPKKINE